MRKTLLFDFSASMVFFFLLFSIYFINFPHKTKDEINIIISAILLFGFICYHVHCTYSSKLYSLVYIFNSTWLVSTWLALLKLSEVQHDLTGGFVIYLLITIIMFNIGVFFAKVKITPVRTHVAQIKPEPFYEAGAFVLGLFFSVAVCVTGYAYEINSVGFIPLLQANEDGFFGNAAPYLNNIHHLSMSLGALSGAALAFAIMTNRFKFFYYFLFLVAASCAASMLAKNIMFLSVAFCLSILNFYGFLTRKLLLYATLFFAMGIIALMNIRLGDSDYIVSYSAIDYDGLPQAFYWFNTYFAINITHLNTYFSQGYTPSYGLFTIQSLTSLLGLKEAAQELIGPPIVYFNGLGGNINVVPLHFDYLSDFGLASVFAFIPLGLIAFTIDVFYKRRSSYFVALLFAGFSYSLGLSVFGNFVHPLMVYISIFFVLIPYFFVVIKNRFRFV